MGKKMGIYGPKNRHIPMPIFRYAHLFVSPLTKLETKNLSIWGAALYRRYSGISHGTCSAAERKKLIRYSGISHGTCSAAERKKLIRLIFCPIYGTYVEDTLSEAKKKGDPSGLRVRN